MVCLPKKPHDTTTSGTPIYTPSNTRPFNIVNSDNRIIATTARHCWEKLLSTWILPRQQGFLVVLSILQNLLEIDTSSMHTSLQQEHGACILLDFSPAFPSISQEYMMEVLTRIGLPSDALCIIQALYDESYCCTQQQGELGTAFHFNASVRQGWRFCLTISRHIARIPLQERMPTTPH